MVVTFTPPTEQEQRNDAIAEAQLVPRPRGELTALQIAAAILYLVNDQGVPRARLEYALGEVGRLENLSTIELAAAGSEPPVVSSAAPVEVARSLTPRALDTPGPSRSPLLSREWIVPPTRASLVIRRYYDAVRRGRALASEEPAEPAPAEQPPSVDSDPPAGELEVEGMALTREWTLPPRRSRINAQLKMESERQALANLARHEASQVFPPTEIQAVGHSVTDLLNRAHTLTPQEQDALSMEVVRSTWVRILANQEPRPSTLEYSDEESLQDIVSITPEDIRSTWARMFSTDESSPTTLSSDHEAQQQARLRITSEDILSTMAGMLSKEESGPSTVDNAGKGQARKE